MSEKIDGSSDIEKDCASCQVTNDDTIPSNLKFATIALLTNPSCRARLEALDSLNDIKRRQRQKMKQDIRFYRKRILTVFKDILMKRSNPLITDRVQCAFDEFARVLIDGLKMNDTADIIQTELIDDEETNETNENGTCLIGEDCDDSIQDNESANTDKLISYANEFLTSSKTQPVTIDKFVIKRQIDEPFPKSMKTKHNEMRNKAPSSKVNLKEPSLRTKGVKTASVKKENVITNYDGTSCGKDGIIKEKESSTQLQKETCQEEHHQERRRECEQEKQSTEEGDVITTYKKKPKGKQKS